MIWKGILTEAELQEVDARLPDVLSFQGRTAVLSPDWMSIYFPPDSDVPVAAACLIDLGGTLWAANYALYQCLAHGIHLRKGESPHAESEAILLEKYYADDMAQRLYSAGEHLANAIVFMLAISDADLEPFRARRTSLQAIVTAFLTSQRQDHPITMAVRELGASADWNAAMNYRGDWVHSQPPLVSGLGLQYRRERRWQTSLDGNLRSIALGATDTPHHTINDIKAFFERALRQFLALSVVCLDYYERLLSEAAQAYEDRIQDSSNT